MQTPNEQFKCIEDLHRVITSKRKEMIPVSQIWTIYQKYNDYHYCEENVHSVRSLFLCHKDHKILYFLLEKIYLARCTDLRLISMVIKRFYAEGIRFNVLVSSLFNEDEKFDTNEIIPMFEYYLKYTHMNKMLFDGRRMASIFFFFTELMCPDNYYNTYLPQIMRLLLQYGICLDPITSEAYTIYDIKEMLGTNQSEVSSDNSAFILLWYTIFNKCFIRNNPQFLPINKLPNTSKQIFNICLEIANMFMRSSLKIRISVFLYPLQYFGAYLTSVRLSRPWQSTTDIVHFIHKMGHFIPELQKRCLEPMPLKHGCKCIIRKLLHLNWELPSGIFKLNLPTPLIQYLNLEID